MHVPEDVVRARKGIVTAVEEKLGAEFFSHTVVFARTPIRPDGPLGEGLKYLVGTGRSCRWTPIAAGQATGC